MLILCGCYTTIRLSPIFPLGPATTCRLTAYKQRLEEYTPSSIVKGYYTTNRATATGILKKKS
jgi:hypothetical protein